MFFSFFFLSAVAVRRCSIGKITKVDYQSLTAHIQETQQKMTSAIASIPIPTKPKLFGWSYFRRFFFWLVHIFFLVFRFLSIFRVCMCPRHRENQWMVVCGARRRRSSSPLSIITIFFNGLFHHPIALRFETRLNGIYSRLSFGIL